MMQFYARKTLQLVLVFSSFTTLAQTEIDTKNLTIQLIPQKLPVHRFYFGNSVDAGIFSTAFVSKVGESRQSTPLRFTMFLHAGFTYNFDFNKKAGIYTGLDLKNIGFIEDIDGTTVKRRVYTLGAPLGIRYGNMHTRRYIFGGVGLDLSVNYKEKTFERRSHKDKFNEWFSSRTPLLMPYIFAGYTFAHGISLKLQYYPNSFLNQNFEEKVSGLTVKPYADYKQVNLLLFSVGFDMHYDVKKKY